MLPSYLFRLYRKQALLQADSPSLNVSPAISFDFAPSHDSGQASQQAWSLGLITFLIMVATYLIPGLIGHDPWKQDETYIFGIVHHMLETGDWVVPTMAGEPFMEKPPLYYWIAAGLAWLFSPWLALHDGARIATGFFMAGTCGAMMWTGQRWWGRDLGRIATLVLLGCLGVVLHAHMMLTDIPLVTGFATALCGFSLIRSNPLRGGLLLGIGVGIGFLAKGILAPGVIGLSAILLPICFRNWRERSYFRGLMISVLAALPWLLVWPIALYMRSPLLFMDWFWLNNIGRFFGFSVQTLGAPHSEGFWLETIPWFTFPALPLALLTVWRNRSTAFSEEPFQLSIVLFSVLMAMLWLSASARTNYALPLLLPICLLAAPAAVSLPALVDRAWDWGARLLFGGLAIFIWTVWILMVTRGTPPDWRMLTRYLPHEFIPSLSMADFFMAAGLTLAAIFMVRPLLKIQGRGLISWFVGLTLCWALVALLWLPWIDSAKSYRNVFHSMQSALPDNYRCIASSGLGESERAMLRYYLGINTQRKEHSPRSNCDVLLFNGNVSAPPHHNIDLNYWVPAWEGARPGDLQERFWLFTAKHSTQWQ